MDDTRHIAMVSMEPMTAFCDQCHRRRRQCCGDSANGLCRQGVPRQHRRRCQSVDAGRREVRCCGIAGRGVIWNAASCRCFLFSSRRAVLRGFRSRRIFTNPATTPLTALLIALESLFFEAFRLQTGRVTVLIVRSVTIRKSSRATSGLIRNNPAIWPNIAQKIA